MINCVYCGGAHARPADIRECWSRSSGAEQSGRTPDTSDASVDRVASATRSLQTAPSLGSPAELLPVAFARRGPPSLGRNAIVVGDAPAPVEWADAERVVIDAAILADPADTVRRLRRDADERVARVFVVETGIVDRFDVAVPPCEVEQRPLHEVGATHEFWLDELHHLVWSNSYDSRRPAGADGEEGTSVGDLRLGDGTPVWLDGGPLRFVPPIDGVPVMSAAHLANGAAAVPVGNTSTAELAPDQLAAVTHVGGSARIIAPAGSGKTRVLTERARHLVRQWRVPPEAVTIVAFNKRAQIEISSRITDLHGVQVRTLNAIGLSILNGIAPFAATRQRVRTVDEPDVRRVLSRLVSTPKKLNVDPLATWIDALSAARLGLADPEDVEAIVGSDVAGFAQVFPLFRAGSLRSGSVDFDEQIVRAVELLLADPAARAQAQRACRYLLVDEFQDLTPAHILLIRLLKGPSGTVFGVGDDDQTIYGYNGADPSWLIDFAKHFPGALDHPLKVNYRCPAGVVDIADRLLRHNQRRVPKVIRAAASGEGGWTVDTGHDPVRATVRAITDAVESGAGASDVAVLTRVNASLAPVQVALTMAGVAVDGGVGLEFLNRTAVRGALAWLRLADGGRFDPADMGEALRRPSRGLNPRVRDWAAEQSDLASLERLANRLTNDRDAAKVRTFAADIRRLQRLVTTGATSAQLISALSTEIGLAGAVSTLDDGRYGMNRSSQSDDLMALGHLALLIPRLADFESTLRDHLVTPRSSDGVLLSTVHRVKGQEWPQVIVHLADSDQFPHRLADNEEEERRLFHVAITRCSEHVTVVTGPVPSPFIVELTTEPPARKPRDPSSPSAPSATSSRQTVPPNKRPDRADHPLLDRQSVYAVPGLVLVDQGHEWTIVALEPEAAVAARHAVTRRFAVGGSVETRGRQRGKLGARPGHVDERSVVVFDDLRRFRDRVRAGKPAYTVFDDKTLAAIADALPADDLELARVKGVGPTKLEQYGDEVLGVVAAVVNGGGPGSTNVDSIAESSVGGDPSP